MRKIISNEIVLRRIETGPMASDESFGLNGAFLIPRDLATLKVIVSDGSCWHSLNLPGKPWEHVSVSVWIPRRRPTWEEMNFVKRLFWDDSETVIQLHVPRDRHISVQDNCLHLWKPTGVEIPLPPAIIVA